MSKCSVTHFVHSYAYNQHNCGGFVLWQRDEATGELVPLLVAGGGGGKAYDESKRLVQSGGGISAQGDGYSADTSQDGPGMRGLQRRNQAARPRYMRGHCVVN